MIGNIQTLARALGGTVISRDSVSCPGPGHSPKDRSLKVMFAIDGSFTVHSFAGDDWQAAKDYVRDCLGLPGRERQRPNLEPRRPIVVAGDEADDKRRTEFALAIWQVSRPPIGSIVEAYLASRGLDLRTANITDGAAIRFHPACTFKLEDGHKTQLPAMVALFRDIITDRPVAIHRTALKADGTGKADIPGLGSPRKMLGPVKGCAIKLTPDDEVTMGLAIAEGVETALTALCNGMAPVWAMGSAGAIAGFPVLHGVDAMTILADHDQAGLEAARTCARRWADAGREAVIRYPRELKADWNDLARRAA